MHRQRHRWGLHPASAVNSSFGSRRTGRWRPTDRRDPTRVAAQSKVGSPALTWRADRPPLLLQLLLSLLYLLLRRGAKAGGPRLGAVCERSKFVLVEKRHGALHRRDRPLRNCLKQGLRR